MIARAYGCLRRWLRKLTTARDGDTPDVIRIGGIVIGTEFVVLAGWSVIADNQAFDATNYGTGAGLILTAIGAALRLKASTEPKEQPDN